MIATKIKRKTSFYLSFVLLLTVAFSAACGKKTVASASNEFDANLMFDILHSNSFQVEKTKTEGDPVQWEISVDEGWFGGGEEAVAIQVLRDYGLPRQPEMETKTTDSLGIVSDREEKERQKRQLQLQIERQLYTLPDVIRASVIIAQPASDTLSLEKVAPTASISLVVKENQLKFSVPDVQSLVSGGVPNLKPESVKVAISQQALREVPVELLRDQRRSNALFAGSIALIVILAAVLAIIWIISRRRRARVSAGQINTDSPALVAANDRTALPEANE